MNDSSQQARAALRVLLRTFGPESVFLTVGELCADEAKDRTNENDVELWEVASDAANDAAASLTAEDEDAEGDESSEDDDDVEADDEGVEASGQDDGAVSDPGQNDEDAPDVSVSPTAREVKQANDATSEGITMKDPRLGMRPKAASLWKCFRVVDGKWKALYHGEDGIQLSEWPIKNLTADVIRDRWGDGTYIVQYLKIDEKARRWPCGRSREILVSGTSQAAAENDFDLPESPIPAPAARTAPRATMSPTPVVMPTMGSIAGPMGQMDPMSFFAMLRETDDRAQARAERRIQLEIERMRAERDAQLERERMHMEQLMRQMELQQRSAHRGGREAIDFDARIASVLGPIVSQISTLSQRVEEALGEMGDDDDESSAMVESPPQPPDPWSKALETIAPVIEHLVSRLSPDPKITIPHVPLPPSDPTNKPN